MVVKNIVCNPAVVLTRGLFNYVIHKVVPLESVAVTFSGDQVNVVFGNSSIVKLIVVYHGIVSERKKSTTSRGSKVATGII